MSISTKRGDRGSTQVGHTRVSKASPEVEALGALDECGAAIGLARALAPPDATRVREGGERLQRALFAVSAGMGAPPGFEEKLPEGLLDRLTAEVHELEAREGMLSGWALPGEHVGGAAFDVARTACRRAERVLVRLHEATGSPGPEALALINRMSDLLWLYGRLLELESGARNALRPMSEPPESD